MPKLFIEAANNDSLVSKRYIDTASKMGTRSRLADFNLTVKTTARLSINMRPHVVSAVLVKGLYENIYQQAQQFAKISEQTVDQELQRLLGPYYQKRIALDAALEIPKSTCYAALNLGGLGAPKYGGFCVVLTGLAVERADTIFVAMDSLNHYVDDDGNVEVDALIANACSGNALPELCCIKHAHDPLLDDPIRWPHMACNDNGYVEAMVDHVLTPTSIAEIRVARNEYDELMELALGGITGKSKGNADRALAQDFVDVLIKAKDAGIKMDPLEVV